MASPATRPASRAVNIQKKKKKKKKKDRAALERYLAGLAIEVTHQTRSGDISSVATFLRTVLTSGGSRRCPATAVIYRGDHPRRTSPRPAR